MFHKLSYMYLFVCPHEFDCLQFGNESTESPLSYQSWEQLPPATSRVMVLHFKDDLQ